MARFILQSDKGTMEDEEVVVERLLKQNKYVHEYIKASIKDLDDLDYLAAVPIGSIDFVTKYLKNTYGIEVENPIEIPWYLQTEDILKREYTIVDWKHIPRVGKFFLKDVSKLKEFSEIIRAEYADIDELFNYVPVGRFDNTLVLNKSHYFQVSQPLNIKSEYRVYVIDHKVVNICNYDGNPMILPDINLINQVINKIIQHEKWLKSYTIDLAVGDFGTALLEVHNFSSVGLYSTLWGSNLLYAYKDGIDYLLNDNEPNKFLQKET